MLPRLFRRNSKNTELPNIFGEQITEQKEESPMPIGTITFELTRSDARSYLRNARKPAVPEVKEAVEAAYAESTVGDGVDVTLTVEQAEEFVRKADRPTRLNSGTTLKSVIERALEAYPSLDDLPDDDEDDDAQPVPAEFAERVLDLLKTLTGSQDSVKVEFHVPIEDAKEILDSEDVLAELVKRLLKAHSHHSARRGVNLALAEALVDGLVKGGHVKSQADSENDSKARLKYLSVDGSTSQRKVFEFASQGDVDGLVGYLIGEDVNPEGWE